jgi:hypothetical protein
MYQNVISKWERVKPNRNTALGQRLNLLSEGALWLLLRIHVQHGSLII